MPTQSRFMNRETLTQPYLRLNVKLCQITRTGGEPKYSDEMQDALRRYFFWHAAIIAFKARLFRVKGFPGDSS